MDGSKPNGSESSDMAAATGAFSATMAAKMREIRTAGTGAQVYLLFGNSPYGVPHIGVGCRNGDERLTDRRRFGDVQGSRRASEAGRVIIGVEEPEAQ